MHVAKGLLDAIGGTPLVELTRLEAHFGCSSKIYAKLERANPTGSVKDRAAKAMILDAEEKGLLKEGGVIIEPTSGNTGIGLAAIAAAKGYRLILFMPSSVSKERVQMMKAFGAEVRLVSGTMADCVSLAKEEAEKTPGSFIPAQFDNPANPLAHYQTTGPEIEEALNGDIDIFCAGFGTGGTLIGAGKYLKERHPSLLLVGGEPASSALISTGKAGKHKIQGIGANFQPSVLDLSLVDRVETITDLEAYEGARLLARYEGLFCGISSGANFMLALHLAKEFEGKSIVTVLPDDGERYLSVEGLFGE